MAHVVGHVTLFVYIGFFVAVGVKNLRLDRTPVLRSNRVPAFLAWPTSPTSISPEFVGTAPIRTQVLFEDRSRLETTVQGRSVTLIECRPTWRKDFDPEWPRHGVSKMRHEERTIFGCSIGYWADRDRRWHLFEVIEPETINGLLEEIESIASQTFGAENPCAASKCHFMRDYISLEGAQKYESLDATFNFISVRISTMKNNKEDT